MSNVGIALQEYILAFTMLIWSLWTLSLLLGEDQPRLPRCPAAGGRKGHVNDGLRNGLAGRTVYITYGHFGSIKHQSRSLKIQGTWVKVLINSWVKEGWIMWWEWLALSKFLQSPPPTHAQVPSGLDGERECCVLLSYPLLSLVCSLACLLLHFQAKGHKMVTGILILVSFLIMC